MIIAIVGAESTGKTSLAEALTSRLQKITGRDCVFVPEWLRAWCDATGRTPRPDEQWDIAKRQAQLLHRASSLHDIVLADTTPLMTAVYSDLLFKDPELYPFAIAFQQTRCDATLLTSPDLPWVADGFQRDGPQMRDKVDCSIRSTLAAASIPWSDISGSGASRVEAALAALSDVISQTKGY